MVLAIKMADIFERNTTTLIKKTKHEKMGFVMTEPGPNYALSQTVMMLGLFSGGFGKQITDKSTDRRTRFMFY